MLSLIAALLAIAHAETPHVPLTYDSGLQATSADGAFALKIGARTQLRATAQGRDGALMAFAEPRRIRLKLSGHVIDERLTFFSQLGWDRGEPGLVDAWVDHAFSPGLHLRAGQMKRPFARAFIMSTTGLSLVDRAITHDAFANGRDIGAMVHTGLAKRDGIEAALGVFNGPGPGPQVVGRVGYNSDGSKGYQQVDFGGDGVRGGASVNAQIDTIMKFGADGIVKMGGLGLMGAVYASTTGEFLGAQNIQQAGAALDADVLLGDRVVPAIRFARVVRRNAVDSQEAAAALALLFHGHRVKWTHELAVQTDMEDDPTSLWRVQSQLELNY